MSALASGWAQVRREWQGNPRLRWAVAVAAAIALVYLCLLLLDWRAELHARYQQRTLQLYKVAALAGQDDWLVRADRARALAKGVQAEIPRAASLGLAQAEVQTTVRQLLNAFGGARLSSDPRPPAQVPGQPGLWRIPFTLRGVTGRAQMLEILRRIESAPRLMAVEEFSFSFVQGMPNLTLTAVAYYRIDPAKPAAGGGSDGTR